jgi:hypothetical protein
MLSRYWLRCDGVNVARRDLARGEVQVSAVLIALVSFAFQNKQHIDTHLAASFVFVPLQSSFRILSTSTCRLSTWLRLPTWCILLIRS